MKVRLVSLLTAAVMLVCSGCGFLGKRNTTLYILMYHNLAPDGWECNDWTVSAGEFRKDLQWLTDNGYEFVLPSELAAGKSLPEKAVMLTFDDGYASNYEIGYPILQEYGAKAVIALITKRIEDGVEGFLTWDMCREMQRSGLVEFGSHTHDVHALANQGVARGEGESWEAYDQRVIPDVDQSIRLIQQELGTTPVFFAYPYGRTDEWISDYMKEHFSVTVTTEYRAADISGGLYELPRITVNNTSDLSEAFSAVQ